MDENYNENYADYDFSSDCDDKDFREWLEKAAGGDTDAMCELGRYYSNLFYKENDLEEDFYEKAEVWDMKALYWYEKAAALGHIHAHACIGNIYYDGNGIDRDHEKIVYWYTKGAELDDDWAQYSLGRLYKKGFYVEQSHKEAAYWLVKAAEQNHGLACESLGESYRDGEGVERDIKRAVYWLLKADEGGVFGAWEKLEEIIQEPDAAEKYGFADRLDEIIETIKRHKKDIEIFLNELDEKRQEYIKAELERQEGGE